MDGWIHSTDACMQPFLCGLHSVSVATFIYFSTRVGCPSRALMSYGALAGPCGRFTVTCRAPRKWIQIKGNVISRILTFF